MQFKNLLKVSLLALFCFFMVPAMAQNKTITGKVTDSKDGSPLIGASISAKGSTAGAITDINGAFKLTVPASTTTLVVSYIGYVSKDVLVTSDVVNVTLDANNNALNEVLVVGYGTVRKKDATGAVVKVNSADFVQGVTTDPLQQLQGKAAGVVVATTNGDPNGGLTVRIRGTVSLTGGNDPLYVIDGVEGADPRALSPNDVESFDILKDASSAAIYGSRAAGGVIMITTKQGKAGKAQVSFNTYVASESYEHLMDFANASQYLSMFQSFYGHPMATFNPASPSTTSNQGANTNWYKALLRTGLTHNENLSVAGGTDKSHYRASVTYTDQQGIALASERKDLNARFNFDQKTLDDKLLITMNLQATHTNANYTDGNAFSDAAFVPSVISEYDPLNPGHYQYINNTDETNPVPHLTDITNTGAINKMSGNLRLDYTLAKGLVISPFANGSLGNASYNLYLPPSNLLSAVNDQLNYTLNQTTVPGELLTDGDVDKSSTADYSVTYGIYANYKTTFGKSRLNLLGGYEGNQFNNTGLRVAAHNFNDITNYPNENIGAANLVTNKDINSYDNGFTLQSYFGRAEYNFNDKYYITGNVRYDYSNKLGLNNQSEVFPSVDAAWVVSNEDFLKQTTWLTSLKIRGGWGKVGDQSAISPYASQFLFGSTGNLYYDGATGTWLTSNFSTQNQNNDLKWETVTTVDLGVDFSLFQGRLTGNVDYYSKTTNNLLFDYTVPTGGQYFVGTILANVGTMTNKGFEFSLNGAIAKSKDFSWNLGANVSINRNKIVSLSGALNNTQFNVTQSQVGSTGGLGISGAVSQIGYLKVGYPIGTLLLPEYAGQDGSGKQLFYYNKNGSRQTTSNIGDLNMADDGTGDRRFYTTDPKFTYGISNNFTYKHFDLVIFLRGQYGSKGFNQNDMNFTSLQKLGTYAVLASAAKDHITSSSEPSSYFLESTSFLKVQNATLGYTFKLSENKYIDKLHIYVAGNNLYTFTSYKGIDAELTTAGGQTGIDQAIAYPRTRELSFGVNLTLK
ncbi:SusC/RagA family TonB-linked outer membrane protein [Mucilaginibacter gotjawali]|uniref:TonB dependent receptor n=2 Tax=Mucilaginibacter gotjawali TaxID=1550579 RepID=A0A0X8X111_9SPHI|nr:SusC/RagA family TonB-linked outer membrane protein [Mucilaginibacter gotjawali]MBB3058797.1 iron complex outermembrane receptor protein [Mucilaginibacter gotjawali]BAU53824.1 TonB dependent receptor [Mucilaginibacter gotjawali]